MSYSLSNENKNSNNLTLDAKGNEITWADASWTWDEETGQWQQPQRVPALESKNSNTLSMESKNYNTGKTVGELLMGDASVYTFETYIIPGTQLKNMKFTDTTGLSTLESKNSNSLSLENKL